MKEGDEEGEPQQVETVAKDQLFHCLKFLISKTWKEEKEDEEKGRVEGGGGGRRRGNGNEIIIASPKMGH